MQEKLTKDKNQLLIDKMVLHDCKNRHINLGMTWIDYKKAYVCYDSSFLDFRKSWISTDVWEYCVIYQEINEKLEQLTSCGEHLAKIDIRRGIFQGDSLSPMLFVICLIPVTQILRKVESGYTLKNGEKLNHFLFWAWSKWIGFHCTDIGVKFGIKKCGVLVFQEGK